MKTVVLLACIAGAQPGMAQPVVKIEVASIKPCKDGARRLPGEAGIQTAGSLPRAW